MPKPKKKADPESPMHGASAKAAHAHCGAKTRGGGTCKHSAGKRTDHPGEGRCWLHGGANPIKHGRYSTIKRPRLAELIATFEGDPDPLNILPEVTLLRALITDYVERYDEFTTALVAWHESYINKHATPNPKPTQVIDILSAAKFIGQIGSLVERIEKQKAEGTVSLEAVNRYVETLGMEVVGALQETIADADSRSKALGSIDRRWQSLPFDTGASTKPRRGRSAEGPGES